MAPTTTRVASSFAYSTPCPSSRSGPPSSMTQRRIVAAAAHIRSAHAIAGELPHARGHAQPCDTALGECLLAYLDAGLRGSCEALELAAAEERALARCGASSEAATRTSRNLVRENAWAPIACTPGLRRHAQSTAARKGLGADLDAVGRDLVLVLRDGNRSQAQPAVLFARRARARRRLCNQLPKMDFPKRHALPQAGYSTKAPGSTEVVPMPIVSREPTPPRRLRGPTRSSMPGNTSSSSLRHWLIQLESKRVVMRGQHEARRSRHILNADGPMAPMQSAQTMRSRRPSSMLAGAGRQLEHGKTVQLRSGNRKLAHPGIRQRAARDAGERVHPRRRTPRPRRRLRPRGAARCSAPSSRARRSASSRRWRSMTSVMTAMASCPVLTSSSLRSRSSGAERTLPNMRVSPKISMRLTIAYLPRTPRPLPLQ